MDKIKKIGIGHIVFLLLAVGVILLIILNQPKREDAIPEFEPAPPEAPRLSSLGAIGEQIDFSPEVRYYEIKVAMGNPVLPKIWANALSAEYDMEIQQAYFAEGANEAFARVYLDDGKYQNSYAVKFLKDKSLGVVLQYDDRYTFTPGYNLKEGEAFTFKVENGRGNVTVDGGGVIRAVAVSDKPATVSAYVGDKKVDSLSVTSTVKAVLNMFIVAGQGNAAGEGGNAAESVKPLPGTAYTVEPNDREFNMSDLSAGRAGFTPALAAEWYKKTGEKSLFVQTAISDVSITDWTQSGEAYKMALTRIEYYKNNLTAEDSPYTLNKVCCFWLHGEWDIAHGMTTDKYIYYFHDFYEGMKAAISPEMTAIIPVRDGSFEGNGRGISPVCLAQYVIASNYEDVRIITELPETIHETEGMISDGLYYSQKGYNALGEDAAYNLFNCYSAGIDKSVKRISVYGSSHGKEYAYGETVKLKADEKLQTVALVAPLYANTTMVNVTYDERLLTYTNDGVIGIAETNEGEIAEIRFECGGMDFMLKIACAEEVEETERTQVTYSWDFNTLDEGAGNNGLTLSGRSDANGYTLTDGVLVSNDKKADFAFAKPFTLDSENDWSVSWKGSIKDNGILLGNEYSTKGYIYLAPFAQNMGYSVRLVDNDGETFYLSYGNSAELNRAECNWVITYTAADKTLRLYSNGAAISESVTDGGFVFTFTNLLGRYGSDTVNYCYGGSLDSLTVSFFEETPATNEKND